jgi:hypothetical protein
MAAQESSKSNKLRQVEKRDRRRQQAASQLSNGATHAVTPETRGDPPRPSYLIRSDLSKADLSGSDARARGVFLFPERYERRRIPEEPSVFMVIDDAGSCLGLVRISDDGDEQRVEP